MEKPSIVTWSTPLVVAPALAWTLAYACSQSSGLTLHTSVGDPAFTIWQRSGVGRSPVRPFDPFDEGHAGETRSWSSTGCYSRLPGTALQLPCAAVHHETVRTRVQAVLP